jgi:hypothetical protein
MAQRERGRVGRNEQCPCGSGKKYKRCCWATDEEAPPRPPEPVWDDPLDEEDFLLEVAGELTSLAGPGGPLEALRWDPMVFTQVVVVTLPRAMHPDARLADPDWPDGRRLWEVVCDLAKPALVTPDWVDAAERTAMAALPRLDPSLRGAVELGLEGLRGDHPVPLLYLCAFPHQLHAWTAAVEGEGGPAWAQMARIALRARFGGRLPALPHGEGRGDLVRAAAAFVGSEGAPRLTLDEAVKVVLARDAYVDPDAEFGDMGAALVGTGAWARVLAACESRLEDPGARALSSVLHISPEVAAELLFAAYQDHLRAERGEE